MLKLNGITKIYDVADENVVALSGVNIEFRKSEFVSVLGPSGCGKTTLLNIIGGLDKYTEGDMFISGVSTAKYTDRDWDSYRNHSIGFVFQNYNLIPHLSVLDNVELALNLVGEDKEVRSEKALKALESVGLRNKALKKPNQLSGGQMQRVAIARALINNPDIILADEPTGALDSETSVQIMAILKEISKSKLVIMVTHNGELAREYSTRIVRLYDGKVVGDTCPFVTDDNGVATGENDYKAQEVNALRIENGKVSEDYSPLDDKVVASAENSYLQEVKGITFAVFTTPRGKYITPLTAKLKKDKKGEFREKKVLSQNEQGLVKRLFGLEKEKKVEEQESKYLRKPAMKLLTALKLGVTNLSTKRFRTALTAIAGSIGVLGIALILGLNAGLNGFISRQEVALASYPISITRSTGDYAAMVETVVSSLDGLDGKYEKDKVYVYKLVQQLIANQTHVNEFDLELLEKIRAIDSDLYYDVCENYGLDFNVVKKIPVGTNILGLHKTSGMYYMAINTNKYWSQLPSEELVLEQYELLAGNYPTGANQILLVLDAKNQISDINLFFNGLNMDSVTLNYKEGEDVEGLTFNIEDFIGQEYRLVLNDKYYVKNNDGNYVKNETTSPNGTLNAINSEIKNLVGSGYEFRVFCGERLEGSQGGYNYTDAISGSIRLEISGVIKLRDDVSVGALGTTAIGYTSQLMDMVIQSAYESKVVQSVIEAYEASNPDATDKQKSDHFRSYGYAYIPSSINIYCKGYNQKVDVKSAIATISEERKEEGKSEIVATDVMSIVLNIVKQFINIITIALLSLTAISLVVSLLMLGIITYVSVLERTREIGVLRALGARKKDVSRIFCAETIIIGFLSGLLGVALTYVVSLPLGAMFESLTGIAGLLALPWFVALLVVVGNTLLTFIAGLIPSSIAKRKDPVKALRAE